MRRTAWLVLSPWLVAGPAVVCAVPVAGAIGLLDSGGAPWADPSPSVLNALLESDAIEVFIHIPRTP